MGRGEGQAGDGPVDMRTTHSETQQGKERSPFSLVAGSGNTNVTARVSRTHGDCMSGAWLRAAPSVDGYSVLRVMGGLFRQSPFGSARKASFLDT
ncbi:Transcriptional Repressor P66-Alpha [Manis pentadactyla]|nr:Transcriptional Repressor P66-Alpha [Manis pentadactyla]